MENLALMIPILGIVMGIGIGMLAIYLNYKKHKELSTLYHQERMAAIEKGLDCPPWPEGLLAEGGAPVRPRRNLLAGLFWLFIGLGAGIAVWATVDFRRALFALIPIGIGAANLIYYYVETRKRAETEAPAAPAPRP